MASLTLQALHKRFGEVVALGGMQLSIKSGEFVSFLGPSGCGKTTALRIIAGFERADSGSVLVDGKDITNVPANRRDMGMVFQAYSLFPNLTAQQNIEFGLRVRGRPRESRARRARELLDMVGLGAAVGRYPHQLSGGQQQRVALARALAIQPRVLLLDEPLSALDALVRVQLRDEIRRIQRELRITTVYVTHDQEEALSVSDHVVVLSNGRIEQVGKPADIYGDPATVFVANFIGVMNRLAGTVSTDAPTIVDCGGTPVAADLARDAPAGQRVLILMRPESLEVSDAPIADVPFGCGCSGHITAHTFLGSVTRLQITCVVGSLMVDVPSTRALDLEDGKPVTLTWNPESARLLKIPDGSSNNPPSMSPEHVELQTV